MKDESNPKKRNLIILRVFISPPTNPFNMLHWKFLLEKNRLTTYKIMIIKMMVS